MSDDTKCKNCGSEVDPAVVGNKCSNCGVRFMKEEVQDDTET